jgi:hypothetical protein
LSALEEKYSNLNTENEKLMERYVRLLQEKSVIYEENYFLKQEKSDLTRRLALSSEEKKPENVNLDASTNPSNSSTNVSDQEHEIAIEQRARELAMEEEKLLGVLANLELRELSLQSLERCLQLSTQVQSLQEENRQLARDLLHQKNGKLNEKMEVLKVKQESLDLREERENMLYERIDLGIKYFRLKEKFEECESASK